MFINTITWVISAAYIADKKTKKYIPETNFILHYGMRDYIFVNKYDLNVKRYREEGVEYSDFFMNNPSGGNPISKSEFLGVKPRTAWRFSSQTMQKYIEEGRIYKKGDKLRFKNTIEGFKVTNLFKTTTVGGPYPSQKPTKLLKRIICLSTK